MNKHTPALNFAAAARQPDGPRADELRMIYGNICLFLDKIEKFQTEGEINTPEAEQELFLTFYNFLSD